MKRAVKRACLALFAAAAMALAAPAAQAGRSCDAAAPSAAGVAQSMTLAEHTARWLDASGAQVVVLARAGQDLSRYGLRWSHLGFAYRDGRVWRVAHKLNACGTAEGQLFRQGLGEFFLDDPFRYEAGVAVLSPEVQARLLPLLSDNRRLATLHEPAYSMVAYPWAQTYQQSNQWAIETLALAMDPADVTGRAGAQDWLKWRGYQPTTLNIGPMTRLGARLSSNHIAFDDHPAARRFSDRIDTVSADSVFAWLARSGLGGALSVVR